MEPIALAVDAASADRVGPGRIGLCVTRTMDLVIGSVLLFRQRRVGFRGRELRVLKFRTMVHDADARKADLLHLNEADGLFKSSADPRVTRVGGVLRATYLDELPQLISVMAT